MSSQSSTVIKMVPASAVSAKPKKKHKQKVKPMSRVDPVQKAPPAFGKLSPGATMLQTIQVPLIKTGAGVGPLTVEPHSRPLATSTPSLLSPAASQPSPPALELPLPTPGERPMSPHLPPRALSPQASLSPRPMSPQVPLSTALSPVSHEVNQDLLRQLDHLQKEHESMAAQLDAQIQINADLKKLLVASVGDDLECKLNKMATDKMALGTELDDFRGKATEDFENIQYMSIQADVWRSKFMASRVMVDELAGWKARLFMHYREARHALKQIMLEREEMRNTLIDTHRALRVVKDAVDPYHMHDHSLPLSMDTLSIGESNGQLADKVRYLLTGTLPTHATHLAPADVDCTPAEALASGILSFGNSHHALLEDPLPVPASLRLPPVPLLKSQFAAGVKHDGLTFMTCGNCKGDIQVV